MSTQATSKDGTRRRVLVPAVPVRIDRHGTAAVYRYSEFSFFGYGACTNADPDLFVPDTYHGREAEEARKICLSCPVLDECRTFIEKYPDDEGIWAAMLPAERKSQ